ncbi:Rv1733c family protein [Streptomyces sp. IBSBF 3136]|uniref:Rv1733c family protein n=1 Tax=Streptomyces sp. IBSBF 3136 TaxID=2903524 RepID=UPI002FDC6C4D
MRRAGKGRSGRRGDVLWRWRKNPLRRREDLVEAWVLLAVWLVVVIGAAAAALVTARAAGGQFAHQRADRHPVRAVLRADASGGTAAAWSSGGRVWVPVRWTAPDGTPRTGRAPVESGLRAGARVALWQDEQGRITAGRPTGGVEGAAQAGLFGAAAALAVAAPACLAGAVARAHLDRRRLARWDREWEQVGPRWGHRRS